MWFQHRFFISVATDVTVRDVCVTQMTELHNNVAPIIEIFASSKEKCSHSQLDFSTQLEGGYAGIFQGFVQT